MMTTDSGNSNKNTRSYWDHRFASGNWDEKGGRQQTTHFAQEIALRLGLSSEFSGTILDFGCAAGDAIPVYRSFFPKADLRGIDFSDEAIQLARTRHGEIAKFTTGDHTSVPPVDVIIASSVFEHLSEDRMVARHLLQKCHDLYIIVPYRERIRPGREHVNSYAEDYYRGLGDYESSVYLSRGWSQYGYDLWMNVYLKNLLRPLFGKEFVTRRKMIMFHFRNGAPVRDAPDS